MKVVSTEFEPQVRAVPVAEVLAPVRPLAIRKLSHKPTPASVHPGLFPPSYDLALTVLPMTWAFLLLF